MSDYTALKVRCLARFGGRDYQPDGPLVWAWHVHHDRLVEPLTCPLADRVDWIVNWKPAHEIPIRLEWLRPVEGEVPHDIVEAWERVVEVDDEWANLSDGDYDTEADWASLWLRRDRVGDKWRNAMAAYKKARSTSPALAALHEAELPGCPWDGKAMVFGSAGAKEEKT